MTFFFFLINSKGFAVPEMGVDVKEFACSAGHPGSIPGSGASLVALDGKQSACNTRDLGSLPRLGRCPEGGHVNPLQYFAWRIPMDRGARLAAFHGVAESNMNELLSIAQHSK